MNKQINDDEYLPLRLGEKGSVSYKPEGSSCKGPSVNYQMDDQTSSITVKNDAVEQDNTTKFVDLGDTVTAVTPTYVRPNLFGSVQTMQQDIAKFLSKPIVVVDTTLAQGVTIEIDRQRTDNPVFNAAFPMWYAKTQGIYGMTFTTVHTMKINGSRFDSGIVSMAFAPDMGSPLTGIDEFRSNTRTQLTQMSHVDFDINSDSSVELRVPWVCARPFRTVGAFGPGELVTYVYAPYNSTVAAQTVRITVYTHLEDVTFFGNIQYQSSNRKVKLRNDVLTQEEDGRLVSRSFRIGAQVSSALSTVPLLSTIFSPVSWLMDAASKAAYMWGYSAPTIVEPPVRMKLNSVPYIGNFNKHSVSQPLCISATNKVDNSLNFFGTDKDEMAIDFMKGIFSYYTSFDLTNAQVDEERIFLVNLNPREFSLDLAQVNTTRVITTPVAFLAHLYARYRGGFKFRFVMAKTEFHRCRLGFVFTPINAPATWDETDPAMRHVVDIRGTKVIEIETPWLFNSFWNDVTVNSGQLSVWKLDDLRSGNSETPSTIRINVEVCGADDLMFASRSNIRIAPARIVTFQSANKIVPIVNDTIGNSIAAPKDLNYAALSHGEAHLSLLQILKAGSWSRTATGSPAYTVWPHSITMSTTADPATFAGEDTYVIIACCYAGIRGGMRMSLFSVSSTTARPVVAVTRPQILNTANYITTATPTDMQVYGYNNNTVVAGPQEGVMCVDLPQNTALAVGPTTSNTILNGAAPTGTSPCRSFFSIFRYDDLATNIDFFLHRAVKDDFRLGTFISTPILLRYPV
jgi:hypothetical protein